MENIKLPICHNRHSPMNAISPRLNCSFSILLEPYALHIFSFLVTKVLPLSLRTDDFDVSYEMNFVL